MENGSKSRHVSTKCQQGPFRKRKRCHPIIGDMWSDKPFKSSKHVKIEQGGHLQRRSLWADYADSCRVAVLVGAVIGAGVGAAYSDATHFGVLPGGTGNACG